MRITLFIITMFLLFCLFIFGIVYSVIKAQESQKETFFECIEKGIEVEWCYKYFIKGE